MSKIIAFIVVLALLPFLGACSSNPGSGGAASNATPTSTVGAARVGGDQSGAQAAETGSASASINPTVNNILAAKKVTITRNPDGSETLEVEGSDDATITVQDGTFGNFRMGNETTTEAGVHSGSQAGAGGSSSTSGNRGGGGQ